MKLLGITVSTIILSNSNVIYGFKTVFNIYSNAPRRPTAEGYLNDNFRNRAILHATYQVGIGLIPESKSLFKKMLNESQNLNAYDSSQNLENDDLTTPEGIY